MTKKIITLSLIVFFAGISVYLYFSRKPSADVTWPVGYNSVTTPDGRNLIIATSAGAIWETLAKKELTVCDWPVPYYQVYDWQKQLFYDEGTTSPSLPEYDTVIVMPRLIADPASLNFEHLAFYKLPDSRSYMSLHMPWTRDRVGFDFPKTTAISLGENFVVSLTSKNEKPLKYTRFPYLSPPNQLKVLPGDNRDQTATVHGGYAIIPFRAIRRSENGWQTLFAEGRFGNADEVGLIDEATAWYMVVDRQTTMALEISDARKRGSESIIHQFRRHISEATDTSVQFLPNIKMTLDNLPSDIDTTQVITAILKIDGRSTTDNIGIDQTVTLRSNQTTSNTYYTANKDITAETIKINSFAPLLCNGKAEQSVEVRYYDASELVQETVPNPDSASSDLLTKVTAQVTYNGTGFAGVGVQWSSSDVQVLNINPSSNTISSDGLASALVKWLPNTNSTPPIIDAKLILESGDTITRSLTLTPESEKFPTGSLQIKLKPDDIKTLPTSVDTTE